VPGNSWYLLLPRRACFLSPQLAAVLGRAEAEEGVAYCKLSKWRPDAHIQSPLGTPRNSRSRPFRLITPSVMQWVHYHRRQGVHHIKSKGPDEAPSHGGEPLMSQGAFALVTIRSRKRLPFDIIPWDNRESTLYWKCDTGMDDDHL
jgi:hypothetical protein